MPEKRPTIQEFEHHPSALIHEPTGATWTMVPGSTKLRSFRPSKLGMVLQNGDLYLEGEVRRLAMTLLQKPPPSPKDADEKLDRRWRHKSHTLNRRCGSGGLFLFGGDVGDVAGAAFIDRILLIWTRSFRPFGDHKP
jgi:hypothetical protein